MQHSISRAGAPGCDTSPSTDVRSINGKRIRARAACRAVPSSSSVDSSRGTTTMATAPISPASGTASLANLQLQDLLKVLLTELTHQDPFEPVDNKDFMAQIAQFASLDTTQQLNQNVSQLLTLQAINESVGLIGRKVSAVTNDGVTITGIVSALTLSNGLPRLTIHDAITGNDFPGIAIGQLTTVRP